MGGVGQSHTLHYLPYHLALAGQLSMVSVEPQKNEVARECLPRPQETLVFDLTRYLVEFKVVFLAQFNTLTIGGERLFLIR